VKRNLEKIKSNKFDILVVGGGIHGALLVWEAARHGFKCCLIEKSDFGSQTSANSLKVLHGGFRYIQHANIKRMRESIYSRKVFLQMAPHLIQNVPFIFPTSGVGVKSRIALSIALFLNDIIALDRNKNILEESSIQKGKTIDKNKLNEIVPGLQNKKVNGGAVWYESVALNTERLLLDFLHDADELGAQLANYVKAEELVVERNKVTKVKARDEITGEEFSINTKYVIDSVGPWLNRFLTHDTNVEVLKSPLTKAVNVIVKKNFFDQYAVGIESAKEFEDKEAIVNKGKRLFFLVPVGEYTMIGTTYKVYDDDPDTLKITDFDIQDILDEVNESYRDLNIEMADVVRSHVGILPMADEIFDNKFNVQPEKHSLVYDHASESIHNLISIKSVKYTTAPSIAKQTINLLKTKFPNSSSNSEIASNNIKNYKSKKKEFFKNNSQFDSNLVKRLWNHYGLRAQKVLSIIDSNDEMRESLFEDGNIYMGELIYYYNFEMGIKSEDFISRRMGLDSYQKIPKEYYTKVEEIISKLNVKK